MNKLKIGINKEKKVVGIWEEGTLHSEDITLLDVSNEDLCKLRNKRPYDTYFIENGQMVLKKNDICDIKERISELKQQLKNYDYIGVKIATGRATIEEYSEQISKMNEWAKEINELEDMLNASENN